MPLTGHELEGQGVLQCLLLFLAGAELSFVIGVDAEGDDTGDAVALLTSHLRGDSRVVADGVLAGLALVLPEIAPDLVAAEKDIEL